MSLLDCGPFQQRRSLTRGRRVFSAVYGEGEVLRSWFASKRTSPTTATVRCRVLVKLDDPRTELRSVELDGDEVAPYAGPPSQ